jgi:hypothetical protein
VVVARVGRGLAQVEGVARRAQQRPGDAEREERLLVHRGDVAQALQDDLVLVEQVAELVDPRRHHRRELP